jgi:hypothetical protein
MPCRNGAPTTYFWDPDVVAVDPASMISWHPDRQPFDRPNARAAATSYVPPNFRCGSGTRMTCMPSLDPAISHVTENYKRRKEIFAVL